ncbi:MAG: sulfotransferase [Pseudomonadota bacterium]|nr:sulfotransferase [Pseudomonadota bacterium]
MTAEFEHQTRQATYQRNTSLEGLLGEINRLLEPVEAGVRERFQKPRWPLILVVGAPRSGTTLMTQWLATLGQFAYPTNLLSRFYQAPYVGALIQQMLTDPAYQFRDEFKELSEARASFDSSLGKTSGLLAPNEFWYFWRRFFPYQDVHYLDHDALAQIDSATFLAELAALEAAFDKPLAMKGMIANCNLDYLDALLDRVVFVYTRRQPFYNTQSLLASRRNYSGNLEEWYSFRPREYARLKEMDPYHQVAGQIHYLNQAIETALARMPEERRLLVEYEDFCESPARVYERLRACCQAQGYEMAPDYRGPERFAATDRVTVADEEALRIQAAIDHFALENAKP